jgi:hypothetical protein
MNRGISNTAITTAAVNTYFLKATPDSVQMRNFKSLDLVPSLVLSSTTISFVSKNVLSTGSGWSVA